MSEKFNYIKIPNQWKPYWDSYPEGHTLLEALIHWASQVNKMVDKQNEVNIKLDKEIKKLDDKKTDLTGDHKGTWQGFRPTQVDVALTDVVEKQSVRLKEIVLNVKDFGAKGDGVTDDTISIQQAINSLSNGGRVFFPYGVYKTTQSIYIRNSNVVLDFSPNTIIDFTSVDLLASGIAVFEFCGEDIFSSKVIRKINVGDTRIYVDTIPPHLKKGDMVRITTNELWDDSRDKYFKFEINKVRDIGSNYIDVVIPAINDYEVSGFNLNIVHVKPLENVGVIGGTIKLKKDAKMAIDGVRFDRCYNAFIERCNVYEAGRIGIAIYRSSQIVVKNNYLERTLSFHGLDYGIAALISSHLAISNNKFHCTRTGVDISDCSYHVTVSDNVFLTGNLNTHACFLTTIIGNQIHGRILFRGAYSLISNNIIRPRHRETGIVLSEAAKQGHITVDNNQIYYDKNNPCNNNGGIRFTIPGATDIFITNNKIYNVDRGIVMDLYVNNPNSRNYVISGNIIEVIGGDGTPFGITFNRVTDATINNNVVKYVGPEHSFSTGIITGPQNAGVGYKNIIISGNRIIGFTHGVRITNPDIERVIITNNIVTGATTPFTISTTNQVIIEGNIGN